MWPCDSKYTVLGKIASCCCCVSWSWFDFNYQNPNTTIMPLPGVCLNILEARQKQNGYGSPTNPDKFLNQDYQELKQYCNIRGVRYIDDMFPPDQASIGNGILNSSDLKRVEWLRPNVSCCFFVCFFSFLFFCLFFQGVKQHKKSCITLSMFN